MHIYQCCFFHDKFWDLDDRQDNVGILVYQVKRVFVAACDLNCLGELHQGPGQGYSLVEEIKKVKSLHFIPHSYKIALAGILGM